MDTDFNHHPKEIQSPEPEKVTLDTNCLIDYLDPKDPDKRAVIRRLTDLHEADVIMIHVSTRIHADAPKDPLAAELLSTAERLQVQTVGAPFRLDESLLDSQDYLSGKPDELLEQRLKEIIAPNVGILNDENNRVRRDIDHLIAHANAGNKYFITSDKEHILCHREGLEQLGVLVISPEEYISRFGDKNG